MQLFEFGFRVCTSSGPFFQESHSLHWLPRPQRYQGHIWSAANGWFPHCSQKPNKENIAYVVQYMGKNASLAEYFSWIADEVKDCGSAATRTVIYTQTIKECAVVYSTLKTLLRDKIYGSEERDPKTVLLEMLHSCTLAVKQGPHPCILPEWSRTYSCCNCNNCFWHGHWL